MDDADPEGAESLLSQARELLRGNLVFGWRLELKAQLISGRLALLRGDLNAAEATSGELVARATALGVPRYVSVGRLLAHQARHRLGGTPDRNEVAADLDLLDASVGVEAWRWTGEVAADLGVAAWIDRAAQRADRLASYAGPYAAGLRAAARDKVRSWRAALR